MPRSRCARCTPALAIGDPYALDENQFAAALALTKRRMHLAGALWQLPGDQIDAFAGGLVDVGEGDWYTAQPDPRPERRRRPHPARARAHPARSTSGCSAPARLHPGCAYRWMRYASGARRAGPGRALLRRHPGQPRRLRRCSARRPATQLHADAAGRLPEAHRVPPHAGRELRRRPALRPVRALGAGLAPSCAAAVHAATTHADAPFAARLRRMSPLRVALLALCTLLVGAGVGYGAAHMGGVGEHARRPAIATAAARLRTPPARPSRRRRPAGWPPSRRAAGRDVRLLPARVPHDRRQRRTRASRSTSWTRSTRRILRAAHVPSARARDRPPRLRQVQERHDRRGLRARDLLVGLPPRPHGELHLAVQRRAAARCA